MAVVTEYIAPVYFVRWIVPTVADVDHVVSFAQKLRREGHTGVHYVAIIPKEVDAPGEDVRNAMRRSIDELLETCETLHLVIEGKGFRRAAIRSIGTSIFLFSRYRGRTFAHDSVDDALSRIGRDVVPDPRVLLKEAAARELLSEAAVPAS
jgi:hypothetical protein